MLLRQINPYTEEINFELEAQSIQQVQQTVQSLHQGFMQWSRISVSARIRPIQQLAERLKQDRQHYAELITRSMGKTITESRTEIDKCIACCEFYTAKAETFLAPEALGQQAELHYQPLGVILGIMPFNFPFWQAFRFAIPTLLAGNCALLKHASNIPEVALTLEELFHRAGIPADVFRLALCQGELLHPLLANPHIKGLAFTGSEKIGRQLAALAGQHLKPVLLELGGSDPFIVLDDADIDRSVTAAVQSRFFTNGQSCINAKRFILTPGIADQFIEQFSALMQALPMGDPMEPACQLGPLARRDLLTRIHQQVDNSIAHGARVVRGAPPGGAGYFFPPTILDGVCAGMPAFEQELFGPVGAMIRADNSEHAIALANQSDFGLGASVWSSDHTLAEHFAARIDSGMVFINSVVRSDPRLPFGGCKTSGLGRELHRFGLQHFCNLKTVCHQ